MTRALYGHDEAVAGFVAMLLDMRHGFGRCKAIGFLDREGRLVAGAVYHNWNPEAGVIEISAASLTRKWGTRGALRTIFAYPFDQLDCQMVVGRTEEGNSEPLHVWRSLGADFHRIPRLRGRDKAEIVTTLTAEQWRESRFHGR